MRKVTILPETTKNPITLIGKRAGICYGADISDPIKNYKRGMDCIKSGHGRTLEFVNVEMVIEGFSARVIREWYTHIGGSPTRLQESTRYIDYANNGFNYVIPYKIRKNKEALEGYCLAMNTIGDVYRILCEKYNIPKEDAAMILPLGMETKIVDKRNLRNLVDMSHQRLCSRAYTEFRELFVEIANALSYVSDEWEWITRNLFVPKCEYLGGCPETKPCEGWIKH